MGIFKSDIFEGVGGGREPIFVHDFSTDPTDALMIEDIFADDKEYEIVFRKVEKTGSDYIKLRIHPVSSGSIVGTEDWETSQAAIVPGLRGTQDEIENPGWSLDVPARSFTSGLPLSGSLFLTGVTDTTEPFTLIGSLRHHSFGERVLTFIAGAYKVNAAYTGLQLSTNWSEPLVSGTLKIYEV